MLINNRYTVIRSLGEGGFGQAYLAEDTQMPSKRQCVIKQLKPIADSPEVYELVQARFQREAAILEQLGEHHRQIPRLYAYFTENEYFYLVQEWVEGKTLEALSLPLPESTVCALLTAVLPVLAFVHDQGIIHRDIKPGNIILRAGSQQPVLIDFGAVKETVNATIARQDSAESIVIGTPGYMPAEQAAGRPLASSDLYSLALTAVYLLTGVPPQMLPSDGQTGELSWQQTAGSVSSKLVAVLTKAIQYHPRDRYSNARDMLADLTSLPGTHSPSVEKSSVSVLPPTIIHPSDASPPPISRQPLHRAANPVDIETALTQVKAPVNAQVESDTPFPEQTSSGQRQEKQSKPSRQPFTVGLIGIAVVGMLIAGGWGLNRSDDQPATESTISTEATVSTEESSTPPASTVPAETDSSNSDQPSQTNLSLSINQKCFSLTAYDPEDSSVNVRDSPDGTIIEAIPNLSIVSIKGPATVEARWHDVSVNNTATKGYIWGELLYRTAYQVNDPTDTFANLRDAAGGNAIAAINNGTEVQFLGTEGDWTQVQLGNGQTGYVSTPLLAEPDCDESINN